MPRTARLRLTTGLATAGVVLALGALAAPAAHAEPRPDAGPSAERIAHLGTTSSNVPNIMGDGLPYGRKL